MDSLRRVGGNLESARRPSGRRAVLLPFEVDLCEQLGITADEYWDFIANAQDFVKERPEEYEGIPDIQNVSVTAIIVNIVVGIAITAISALLAPKPKQPEQKKDNSLAPLDIAGSQGRSRYTKSSNFDGVQSLASLGETIPLIFADRGKRNGGIRVDTQLLFSQMITSGTTQTLMALMLIGAGKLREKPDYAGYAIGDLMLRDFSPYKNQLFCNVGTTKLNRLKTGKAADGGDQYDESEMAIKADGKDAFSLYWAPGTSFKEHFSGTRTPSTRTSFGLYNPMPNGFRYLMPYELVLIPTGDSDEFSDSMKQTVEDSTEKREKIITYFSRYGGIVSSSNEEAVYYLSATRLDTSKFKPWGASDILQAQDETRITVDEKIQEGQEYMLGSCRAICTRRPRRQFFAENESGLEYTFKLLKDLPGSSKSVPIAGTQSKLDDSNFDHDDKEIIGPWSRGCVQQLAVASLSNSRPCDATEIGIKSEVWRQVQNAANFNAHPEYDVIDRYQEANSSINLGTNTKYTKRYSFFKVFARKAGQDNWRDINDGRVFAVRGVSPEYVFNTLFILHDEDQHEFEIVPVAGSEFYKQVNDGGVLVHLLDGRALSTADKNKSQTDKVNGYQIFYTGEQDELSVNDVTNPEWVFSFSGQNTGAPKDTGPILSLGSDDNGRPIPKTDLGINPIANDYKQGTDKSYVKRNAIDGRYVFWWKGTNLTPDKSVQRDFINRTEKYQGEQAEIQYRIYDDKNVQPYEEATWGDQSSMYEITANIDGTLAFNYCVVQVGSLYEYWWRGVKRLVQDTSNDQWHSVNEGANDETTRRYKKTGARKPESTSEQPVEGRISLYSANKNNGVVVSLNTGMSRQNGVTRFYRSGAYLGEANGASQNSIRIGDEIWRRENAQQTEVPDSTVRTYPESGARDNYGLEVDKSERLVRNAMKYGVIQQPSGAYQLYANGEYKAPLAPGTSITIGNRTYSCVAWNDSRKEAFMLGSTWYVAWPIKITKDVPGQMGTWSITKYQVVTIPASWEIKRETFQSGNDGTWWIEKLQREVIGEVEPVKTTNKLIEGKGSGATVELKYYKADTKYDANAKDAYFWKLKNRGDGYRANTNATIEGTNIKVKITNIREPGQSLDEPKTSDKDDINQRYYDFIEPGTNYSPLNAICDYYINNTDTSSHANSPEHQIVFCNEIIEQFAPGADDDSSSSPIPQYSDLALAGIKLLNAKEWTSFNSLSAYIKHGHMVERLFNRSEPSSTVDGKGATNLFPEIAHHLLTSREYGAGKLIGAASVDKKAMEKAARFCEAEGFYWDGIITDSQNLREFIFENAAFMLLDFTIKGGQFALVPSVPFDDGGSYKMQRSAKPDIKALFTDGNMRGMEVSFLSPEERQNFVGVCIFREEKVNAFPELRTMTMRLSDAQGGSDTDPVEKFDCSGFMTSENHARMFLRYALKVRQLVDHGIKFETTPQSAMNLEPGEYFRVATTTTHTERFNSGSVDDWGNITTATQIGNGAVINVVFWKPGETVVRQTSTTVLDNKATNAELFGCLFCQVTSVAEPRVYKCESLSYSSDGLVEVSASVSPLNDKGQLLLLDWAENDVDFKEETF